MSATDPSHDTGVAPELSSFDGGAAYAVKLPVFEGPLDLLLHLIRQNEVDITEIPISLIGEQYLDYLELMHELNIDIAGEYLVMAATLALIKSRMLLPPALDEDGEEEPDPQAELIARLLEYRRYKEVAEKLATRRLLGRDVFEARGSLVESVSESEREIEVGLFDLLSAFRELLDSTRPPEVHAVEVETVTVQERMTAVMELIEGADSLEFSQLFTAENQAVPSRILFVATFLAILELARLGALRLYQGLSHDGAPEGPIRLRGVSAAAAPARQYTGSAFTKAI